MKICQVMQRGGPKVLADSKNANSGWGTSAPAHSGECLVSASFYPDDGGRGIRIEFNDPADFESFVSNVRHNLIHSEIAQTWARLNEFELKQP